MRTTFTLNVLIAFLLLASAGCITIVPVGQSLRQPERISNFPSRPHPQEPNMIFPGEVQPEPESYIQTHIFEVRGPVNASYAELADHMRRKAHGAGVDAVIIISREHLQRWDSMDRLHEHSLLTGLGVIMKENVDYLHNYQYLNQLHLYDAEKDTFELIANIFPDFDNTIIEVQDLKGGYGDLYFRNYIRRYSREFLIEEKSPLWNESVSSNGFITRRTYHGEKENIRLRLHYEQGKLHHIRGRYQPWLGQTLESNLYLKYDPSGKLIGKEIIEKNALHLREVMVYDEWDRLVTSHWYKVIDEREEPFLKMEYYYYTREDVFEMF